MKKLYGITVAMITPMFEDGSVNYGALESFAEFLIKKGVHCLYPCGTTGEMFHLTLEERKRIAEVVVKTVAGRAVVYVHCGAMRQEETIELLRHTQSINADGAGIVTPAFLGANNRELAQYYKTCAQSVPELPVYLYNIPQCSGNDLSPEVCEEVAAECANIVGIKYSYPDINRTIDYTNIRGGDFSVLHGCDRALVSMLAAGCDGTVSGCAGVFPEPFIALWEAYQNEQLKLAQKLQKDCVKLIDILHGGSNMSYFKKALNMRGIDAGHMRAPQLDITKEEETALRQSLEEVLASINCSLNV